MAQTTEDVQDQVDSLTDKNKASLQLKNENMTRTRLTVVSAQNNSNTSAFQDGYLSAGIHNDYRPIASRCAIGKKQPFSHLAEKHFGSSTIGLLTAPDLLQSKLPVRRLLSLLIF